MFSPLWRPRPQRLFRLISVRPGLNRADVTNGWTGDRPLGISGYGPGRAETGGAEVVGSKWKRGAEEAVRAAVVKRGRHTLDKGNGVALKG